MAKTGNPESERKRPLLRKGLYWEKAFIEKKDFIEKRTLLRKGLHWEKDFIEKRTSLRKGLYWLTAEQLDIWGLRFCDAIEKVASRPNLDYTNNQSWAPSLFFNFLNKKKDLHFLSS